MIPAEQMIKLSLIFNLAKKMGVPIAFTGYDPFRGYLAGRAFQSIDELDKIVIALHKGIYTYPERIGYFTAMWCKRCRQICLRDNDAGKIMCLCADSWFDVRGTWPETWVEAEIMATIKSSKQITNRGNDENIL